MAWWKRLVLISLLVVTSLLMVLPALARMAIDYGKPVEARWEQDGEGQRKAVITFDESESLEKFYDLVRSPLRPPVWLLFVLAGITGVSFLVLAGDFSEDEKEFEGWMLATIFFQLLLFGACIVAAFDNNSRFEVEGRITASIQDEELAQKAIGVAHSQQILIVAAGFAALLLGDMIIIACAIGLGTMIQMICEAYKQALMQGLEGGKDALTLRRDGVIEQVRYVYGFHWLPFPAVVPKRTVTGELAWNELCQHLAKTASTASLEGLCRQFKISLSELFNTIGTKTSRAITAAIESGVGDGMKGYVRQSVVHTGALQLRTAEALLQNVSDKALQRFQQEIVALAGEAVAKHLDDFRQQAIAFLQSRTSNEATSIPHDNFIFPEGTKFCLAKGKATVFVVEEKPQTRTLLFRQGFTRGRNARLEKDTAFQLAFPYVVFVVKLWEGKFLCLHAYFSNRPLQALTDTLCWPTLPNIQAHGEVCLNFTDVGCKTASEWVQAAISYFWQSSFNNDLRTHYDHAANPVRNVWNWAKRSKKDPTFVLKTNWRQCENRLEEVVNSLLFRHAQDDEIATAEQAVRACLEQAIKNLAAVVQKACGEVVVEKRHTPFIAKELSDHLQFLGQAVQDCMMARLNSVVRTVNGTVRHQFDYHLQRLVNEAVAQTFLPLAAAALLEGGRLPSSLYQALQDEKGEHVQ